MPGVNSPLHTVAVLCKTSRLNSSSLRVSGLHRRAGVEDLVSRGGRDGGAAGPLESAGGAIGGAAGGGNPEGDRCIHADTVIVFYMCLYAADIFVCLFPASSKRVQ